MFLGLSLLKSEARNSRAFEALPHYPARRAAWSSRSARPLRGPLSPQNGVSLSK